MSSDREREMLRSALGHRSDCPPRERLVDAAFAESPDPAQRALLERARSCPACAAELDLAGAFTAPPEAGEEAADVAWIEARLEKAPGARLEKTPGAEARVLPMRRPETPGSRSRGFAWQRLAAAAMILVGIGLGLRWAADRATPGLPDLPPSDVVRGGELVLDAPIGDLEEAPSELRWRPVPGAASYRVELRDVGGDPIGAAESTTASLALEGGLAARLESRVTYTWTVIALDASGRELARSAGAQFSFR